MKVAKFGGTSMSHDAQFKKVKDIVLSDADRQVVVVSALGKREPSDNKITDLLYTIYSHIVHDVPWTLLWGWVRERLTQVRDNLELDFDLEAELDAIEECMRSKKLTEAFLVSRGEYLTARLMAEYLGYHFVDATTLILFDYDGQVDFELSAPKIQEAAQKYGRILVPGFYGLTPNEKIKLMDRGGSDITGAILAQALGAQVYENWTDISGIMMADPRIVAQPEVIPEISFRQLREMAYMGANVLHDSAVFPVQEAGIPIQIRNTNDPTAQGTIISNHETVTKYGFTGIAGKTGFLSITLFKQHMSDEVGFIWKTMGVFAKHEISIEHLPSGIDNLGVIVSSDKIADKLLAVTKELTENLNVDEVVIVEDLAMISVVGGASPSRVIPLLTEKGIMTTTLLQGTQDLSLIVGVKDTDYARAIRALYEGLVSHD